MLNQNHIIKAEQSPSPLQTKPGLATAADPQQGASEDSFEKHMTHSLETNPQTESPLETNAQAESPTDENALPIESPSYENALPAVNLTLIAPEDVQATPVQVSDELKNNAIIIAPTDTSPSASAIISTIVATEPDRDITIAQKPAIDGHQTPPSDQGAASQFIKKLISNVSSQLPEPALAQASAESNQELSTHASTRIDDTIDIKLTEQRIMDARHLTDAAPLPDELTKTPAIMSGKSGVAASIATPVAALETVSFSAVAQATVATTAASPLTLSSAAPTLNAPSLTSVMQSIIRTVETQKGVSVRLDPPEMGRVYIDYQFQADRSVTAIVRTDLPEALAQLRDNTSILHNLLKENGFDQVNINFEHNNPDEEASQPNNYKDNTISFENEGATETIIPSTNQNALTHHRGRALNQSIDIKL